MNDPPDQFYDQVKDALEHLYDLVYLTKHPLGDQLLPERLPNAVGRAQALRQIILDAINALNLLAKSAPVSRQRRVHQILEMRYVEGMPFREVMDVLAVSQTQYHRDQRHAIKCIGELLWHQRNQLRTSADVPDNSPDLLDVEMACAGDRMVDLNEVVHGVAAVLTRSAFERHVNIQEVLPPHGSIITGSRTLLRQILISLIGHTLHAMRNGLLVVSYAETGKNVVLTGFFQGLTSSDELGTPAAQEHLVNAQQIAPLIGASWWIDSAARWLRIKITFPAYRRSLLVIEDNPGIVQLISRCVSNQGYVVLSSGNVPEGLDLAQKSQPDLILLDLMFPFQDGWDALQVLTNHPDTKHIPVLVCSVLAEADLALALGAADFLRKPLTRESLLAALHRITRHSASAGGSASSTA